MIVVFVAASSIVANAQGQIRYILDMVHHNPGEPLTQTVYNDPKYLKQQGYTGQVMNDFTFAHAAITFDKLNPTIFPKGTKERAWVMAAAATVKANIEAAHKAGIKVYYFTDIIVLPKRLVELYHDEITDEKGKISFERPKTINIHRIMLQELFATFPDLDGLVIRTGETYLNNVPFHTGNNPITNGPQSHIKLINLLRDEVCEKRGKTIFYRTWSFGGMHDSAAYYLDVTNAITPHPNLLFSVKHTKGDYHRTFPFNPTIGIGKHQQIIEVECQREYEGKGAFPDYVIDGVVNGFEEYATIMRKGDKQCLKDVVDNPNIVGIWSWSRGGGWVGPYIKNEFWCKLNAFVIGHWARDSKQSESEVFDKFMDDNGIMDKTSRKAFRKLCLLSAKAVVRGHESVKYYFDKEWVWWMRDHFLGGIDTFTVHMKLFPSEGVLRKAFEYYYANGQLMGAVAEKESAVSIWKEIVDFPKKRPCPTRSMSNTSGFLPAMDGNSTGL